MKVSVETIDRNKAIEYLKHNRVNRNISKNRIQSLVNDIKSGAWQLNGEAIRFNKNGDLIDGQHRLTAIVEANIPIQIVVMRDIENNISLYDRGRGRNVTDSLLIEGMSKEIANNTWVAVAKLHYYIQKRSVVVSDNEVRVFLEKNKNYILDINECRLEKTGNCKTKRLSLKNAPCLLSILYAYRSGEPLEKIQKFVEVYQTGFYDDLSETAAIVLRNDTLSSNFESHGSQGRALFAHKCEKAIYDFCHGYPRKISYNSWKNPVYSNNEIFKEGDSK